jgi:hypothetical protein
MSSRPGDEIRLIADNIRKELEMAPAAARRRARDIAKSRAVALTGRTRRKVVVVDGGVR